MDKVWKIFKVEEVICHRENNSNINCVRQTLESNKPAENCRLRSPVETEKEGILCCWLKVGPYAQAAGWCFNVGIQGLRFCAWLRATSLMSAQLLLALYSLQGIWIARLSAFLATHRMHSCCGSHGWLSCCQFAGCLTLPLGWTLFASVIFASAIFPKN